MTVSPVLQAHVEMIIVMYPKCTLVVDLWSHYLSFIVVTVGIEQTSYTILEANFLFTVNVVLLEGTLGTPVMLSLSVEDGTASCKTEHTGLAYVTVNNYTASYSLLLCS